MISNRLMLLAWMILLLGITPGCGEGDSPQRQIEVIQGDQPAALSKVDEIRPITVEQWVEWGLPSPDQIWRVEQLAEAVAAIENMSRDDRRYLPRLDDEPSAPIFKRLVAEENLEWYRDKQVFFGWRMDECQDHLHLLGRSVIVYSKVDATGVDHGAEITRILSGAMQVLVELLPLIDQCGESQDPNQVAHAAAIKSEVLQMGAGSFNACLEILTETEHYRAEDRKFLAENLKTSLPIFLEWAPDSTHAESSLRVREMAQSTALGDIRPELTALLNRLESLKKQAALPDQSDNATEHGNEATPQTQQEYLASGLPDHNRLWTVTEMRRAATALAKIASEDPTRLPHLKDEKSRPIFQRVISSGDLSLETVSVEEFVVFEQAWQVYCSSQLSILRLYLSLSLEHEYQSETIELMIAVLDSHLRLLQLRREIAQSLGNSPHADEAWTRVKTMERGIESSIQIRLNFLADHENIPLELRQHLARSLSTLTPTFYSKVNAEILLSFQERLEELLESPQLQDLHQELNELWDANQLGEVKRQRT